MADPETLYYCGTIAAGIGLGVLALKHRGTFSEDEETEQWLVSEGDGLSARIIELFPGYSWCSPIVDHLLSGVAMPAFVGGILGLAVKAGERIIGTHIDPRMPYYISTIGYIALNVLYELDSVNILHKRKDIPEGYRRKAGLNDYMQMGADIAAPAFFLHITEKYFL